MPDRTNHYLTVVHTALGWVGLVWGEAGLLETSLPLPDRAPVLERLQGRWPEAHLVEPEQIGELAGKLQRYFEGKAVAFDEPLDMRWLTPFQRRVYTLTRAIPRGATRTYSDLAREVGSPGAARAVGQCMARNPWPILVPCHRVVGSDGGLTGFGGGLEMKRWLLEMERAIPRGPI